jgi:dsRNA-specific ribonuclease
MKRLRLQRWTAPSQLSHATRTSLSSHNLHLDRRRTQPFSSSPRAQAAEKLDTTALHRLEQLPSPPPSAALASARLAALHARLSLPAYFPPHTLARCLVDATADGDARFNNAALARLGEALCAHWMAEHLLCHYPRLPLAIMWAAARARLGPEAMREVARGWGVDCVAEPGGEVDPGLLQFRAEPKALEYRPGYHAVRREAERQALMPPQEVRTGKYVGNTQVMERTSKGGFILRNVTHTMRILKYDQFGEKPEDAGAEHTTAEAASRRFVSAVVGAINLHQSNGAAKEFFRQHFLSRSLDMAELFAFPRPTRDLWMLCAREGFEPPVARLISETGRKTNAPIYVVGIYSGRDKIGEGAGSSLLEAKLRASVAALKGWYLYSPVDVVCPSEHEEGGQKRWKPVMIDCGEVVS